MESFDRYDQRRWSDRQGHSRNLKLDSSEDSDSDSESFSSSDISASSDSDFSDTPKKQKRTKNAPVHRSAPSHPRKPPVRDDLGSVDYQFGARQRQKTRRMSDSYSSESSDSWDTNSDFGVAGRRDPRANKKVNYAESSSESRSSSASDDEQKSKEEHKGPLIEKVLGRDMNDSTRLYVKYKDADEKMRRRWMTQDEVLEVHNGESAIRTFEKKQRNFPLHDMSEWVPDLMMLGDELCKPCFFRVARVFAYDETTEMYYILWEGFDYDEATWQNVNAPEEFNKRREGLEEAVEEFKKREGRLQEALEIAGRVISKPPYLPYGEDETLISEGKMLRLPEFKHGRKLRDYQVDGLNWLRQKWYEGKSAILGDEMGLGKTVQATCMINEIAALGSRGPFLIITPMSTVNQWKREMGEWTDLNVIGYYGKKEVRKVISQYEFYWGEDRSVVKFEVLIVHYPLLLQDEVYELLSSIEWEYMIVDEAHSLKNEESKRYAKVEALNVKNTLLMTGTPIQTKASEIWALLHLVDRGRFRDMEQFIERFDVNPEAGLSDEERDQRLQDLKEMLKPYMLRRTKDEVEHSIGKKEESIVYIELTRTQRELYRLVLRLKAQKLLWKGKRTDSRAINDQFQKICNHPFLYLLSESDHIDETRIHPKERDDNPSERLIKCCGKMIFVDKLLKEIRARRQKVLIFSQTKKILDYLKDLCLARGYLYERIDGEMTANERQEAADRFDKREDVFVFLLSTRSAGQGLNLIAATCVIMYDTDWNPQNDSQAKARSHRIGQANNVTIYRLISRDTFEIERYLRATRKMGMGQAILSSGTTEVDNLPQGLDTSELDKLKREVYAMQEKFDDRIDLFQSESIDEILAHRTVECSGDNEILPESNIPDEEVERAFNEWKKFCEETKDGEDDVLFAKRERKKPKRFGDTVDPWSSLADDVYRYLRKFGYPSGDGWDRLAGEVEYNLTTDELEDGCTVMVWLAVKGHEKQSELFRFITGSPQLTRKQKEMAKDDVFKDQAFIKRLQNSYKRFVDLKKFNDFMAKNQEAPEIPNKDDSSSWTREDDTALLRVMQRIGFDCKWDSVVEEMEENLRDERSEEQKHAFIRKRFKLLMNRIENEGREKESTRKSSGSKSGTKKEKSSSHKEKSSSHKEKSSSHKEKSHSRKKNQPKEPEPVEEEPEPIESEESRYTSIIALLKRFGIPSTDELWQFFSEISSLPDAVDVAKEVIDAATKLLCGEELPEGSPLHEVLNFDTANEIYDLSHWFTRFRHFFTEELRTIQDLDQKIAKLKAIPQWWRHEALDMKFFEHVYRYGTARPCTLLSNPPFIDLVPESDRQLVATSAAEEAQKHIPVEIETAPKLSVFIYEEEVRSCIDELITNLIVADRGLVTVVLETRVPEKPQLPYASGPTIVESLGSTEMYVIDGFLYTYDFQSRVKLDQGTFVCRIQKNNLHPFVISCPENRVVAKASPVEAWEEAVGLPSDVDPYVLFGIGLPVVRFWLQAIRKHNNKAVSGYIDIVFEEQKKPEEEKAQSQDDDLLDILPSIGPRKRKRLPKFPDVD